MDDTPGIAAELARVARDIGATAAGDDNVALSGETLAARRVLLPGERAGEPGDGPNGM